MYRTDTLTGCPSIDRPWLRFYKKEVPPLPSADMGIFAFLWANNKNCLDSIALNYYGNKVSYGEMFNHIDNIASALQSIGVCQGDIVSLCALNTPEFVYLLYALNKIGAVSNWIGLTSPDADIRDQLLQTESKIVFAVDLAHEKIKNASKDTFVERIISIPIETSMPALMRVVIRLKNRKEIGLKTDSWKMFLRNSDGGVIKEKAVNGTDMAMIEYTGGSTGKPKGVMLSNKALNSYYINLNTANHNGLFSYQKGDRYLSGVPFFLAFGVSACCHSPLSHTMELVLAPDPSPEAGVKMILRNKIQHIIGGRLLIDGLVEKAKKDNPDLSYVKSVIYGGEEANTGWENAVIRQLGKNGMNAPVINGYGMTETSAASIIEINGDTEEGIGFVPLANINVKVTDPEDSSCELGYDTEGELCISSDTLMMGYYKKEKETEAAFFEENGRKWLKTQDLATISSDGIINITGRIKRIYSKTDSDRIQTRVYPMRIEECILSDDNVCKCAVVGVKDDITAYRTVAYIILNSKAENESGTIKRLDSMCREKLPESHVPDKYVFVDSFPLTRAGKIDYRALEEIAYHQNTI